MRCEITASIPGYTDPSINDHAVVQYMLHQPSFCRPTSGSARTRAIAVGSPLVAARPPPRILQSLKLRPRITARSRADAFQLDAHHKAIELAEEATSHAEESAAAREHHRTQLNRQAPFPRHLDRPGFGEFVNTPGGIHLQPTSEQQCGSPSWGIAPGGSSVCGPKRRDRWTRTAARTCVL